MPRCTICRKIKLGHCVFQIRPLRVETGQYPGISGPRLSFPEHTFRVVLLKPASPSASERKARGLGFPSTFAYTGSKKEILVCRGPVHKLREPFCFFLL